MRLFFVTIFILLFSQICYAYPGKPDWDFHSYTYLETVGNKKIYYKLNQHTDDKSYDRYNVTIFESNNKDDYKSALYHLEFLDDKNSATLMPYTISNYRCFAYNNNHFGHLLQMEAPAPHTSEDDYIHAKVMHAVLKDNINIPVYHDTRKYQDPLTEEEQSYKLYQDTSTKQIFYIPKFIANDYMIFRIYCKPKGELQQLQAYIYDLYIAPMNNNQIWYSKRYVNSYSSDIPLDNNFVGWLQLSKKKPDFAKIDYDKEIRALIYFLINEYAQGNLVFKEDHLIKNKASLDFHRKFNSYRAGLP